MPRNPKPKKRRQSDSDYYDPAYDREPQPEPYYLELAPGGYPGDSFNRMWQPGFLEDHDDEDIIFDEEDFSDIELDEDIY